MLKKADFIYILNAFTITALLDLAKLGQGPCPLSTNNVTN